MAILVLRVVAVKVIVLIVFHIHLSLCVGEIGRAHV